MMLLPPGQTLQMIAVRCFGLRFSSADHDFLHQSHVFSNISKILSLCEEVLGAADDGNSASGKVNSDKSSSAITVERLIDVTELVQVHTSSREGMLEALRDGSTETFWESSEDDRQKSVVISWSPADIIPGLLYLHFDNVRDLQNKVTAVAFRSGAEPSSLTVRTIEVDPRFSGWIHQGLNGDDGQVTVDLRGVEGTAVRLRQICVLALCGNALPQRSATLLQYKECEQETLKVFRLITSQVFGKLICGDSENSASSPASNSKLQNAKASSISSSEETGRNIDLKEHVVGILFSRSKLTHLQKQVCAHIVGAIRREAIKAREEWETALKESPANVGEKSSKNAAASAYSNPNFELPNDSIQDKFSSIVEEDNLEKSKTSLDLELKPAVVNENPSIGQFNQLKHPDTYCFEMLSMVLALSGSRVGRQHLAQQETLLKHLLALLHTGSDRVQRQIVSLFRRILTDISPGSFATLVRADSVPDGTIQASSEKVSKNMYGILDVFLAVIAKALSVQPKSRGAASRYSDLKCSVYLEDHLSGQPRDGVRWWLRGRASHKLADHVISLLRDMTHGKISPAWTIVSKSAIAENVLRLSHVDDSLKASYQACLSSREYLNHFFFLSI